MNRLVGVGKGMQDSGFSVSYKALAAHCGSVSVQTGLGASFIQVPMGFSGSLFKVPVQKADQNCFRPQLLATLGPSRTPALKRVGTLESHPHFHPLGNIEIHWKS